MILRSGGRPYGLAGIGDAAPAPARKTYPQLAAELKEVLDQVETHAEAKAVGLKAYNELRGLLERLGAGISAGMVRSYLQPSLEQLGAALAALPLFDGPVDETWWGVPNGARRAIQAATSGVWAIQREIPEGSLDAADVRNFVEGFAGTLRAVLRGVGRAVSGVLAEALGGITDGLGIPWWALAAGAGLVVWNLYGDRIRRAIT